MRLERDCLPVCKANELAVLPPEQNWLIESVWARTAVGIIGGAPKCCKSWLGLDMAVSVASATPCLGRFEVKRQGPALVYLAEDAVTSVRARIEALCAQRNLDFVSLDLHVITAPCLRLDLADDQKRLQNTIAEVKPRLVLLDPLVRLHRLDENSASDISNLLGFFRLLQRSFDTAIVLVHHASKKHRSQPGQTLRGSSDLHAFGDSNAYLSRRQDKITLTLEHRSAKPPDPLGLQLVVSSDESKIHLKITDEQHNQVQPTLTQKVLAMLRQQNSAVTRTVLRSSLKVNNQRLGETLIELEKQGLIVRSKHGWGIINIKSAPPRRPHCKSKTRSSGKPVQCLLPF